MHTLSGTTRTHRSGRRRIPLAVLTTLTIVAGVLVASGTPAAASRTPGELVKYEFLEGSGTTVRDSGSGPPLDLTISDPGNVAWQPGGGLAIDASTTIVSPGAATKVTDAVQASGEMTVEAWLTPAAGEQSGPARIVSSSPTPFVRNFMLGQGAWGSKPDDVFASRFRTSTTASGTPTLFTPAGTTTSAPTHVALTRNVSGSMTLYVDGVAEATGTIPGSTATWDDGYPLTLANTADGSRPWLGTLCLVAIYDTALSPADIADNRDAGCDAPPNTDPTVDIVADQTNAEGDTISVDVDAIDPDNDSLTYSATGLADGLTIDPTTGEITGQVTQTAATGSPYAVTVTVEDNRGGVATTSFGWTVTPVNVAPVLDPIGDQTTGQGQTVSLFATATDDDGDTLGFSATGLPTGWTIDPTTGEITGIADTIVTASVTVTVDDDNGGTDVATFAWTVDTAPSGPTPVVRYDFTEGTGTTVGDSGSGPPLDLTITNPGNTTWVPGGGLSVDASTALTSGGPATKVIDAVKASGEMTIEGWITPAPGEQSGPARIVSNAPSPNARNFMLGQGAWGSKPDDAFATRFRTTDAATGTPTLFTPAGTATGSALTHVALTRSSTGVETLYVDGTPEASVERTGTVANWTDSYPLVLANIVDGSRPWLGTLCLVAIYDTALGAGDLADRHSAGCSQVPNRDPVLDPIGDQANDEGDNVLLPVTATDDDGDPLVFSATGLPDGLTIEPSTGRISGTISPTAATGSPYAVDVTVVDGRGGTDTASFTWTVDDVPLPPVAVDDTYGTPFATSLTVGAGSGVLANDLSEGPVSVALEQDAGSGVLALAPDGSFTYTPDPGFAGVDTFSYRATNGSGTSDPATVRVTVAPGGTAGSTPRIVTGTVSFTRQVIGTGVAETHMAVGGDFDGDGDTDVAATDYVNGRVLWFRNDGNGNFAPGVVDGGLGGAYPLHVDDLDGDGDLDLLAGGYDVDTFTWYENDGTASWTRRVIDSAANGAHSVVTNDLDDDGDLDLVASNQDAGTITWYENDGAEGFTRFTVDSSARGAKRAEAADLDGDGLTDILATSNADDRVTWYEHDGSGGFIERTIDDYADGGYYVAPADLDGDGDIDVLAALQVADSITWYENDGAGGFTKQVIDASARGARSVIASDIDGDGDMDAIAASADDDTIAWYENDGSGTFAARAVDPTAEGAYGVFAIDFDNDGDMDLLSATRDDDSVAVHLSSKTHIAAVDPGGTLVIDGSRLSTIDGDDGPAQLTYTLTAAPAAGTLNLDGAALGAGTTFTQADVDRNALAYEHDPGEASVDTFSLAVTDGDPGRSSIPTSFTVVVNNPDDVLVRLPLDEAGGTTAGDVSGQGNDGTLANGASFETDTPDGSDSSVRLDGADDAIQLPGVDAAGDGLSVALWFKADSFSTTDARLVSKATGTAANQHVFMLSTIKVGNEIRLRARVRVGGVTTTLRARGGQLGIGEWHHAALTHDGAVLRLHLDGVEVASTALFGPVDRDASVPVAVGAQPPGAGGRHFDGLVDDVRILQRGLTAQEVAALAGQGS